MSDVVELSTEERLEEASRKLTALETAAWELLSALESGDPDEVAKAKRRLGAVFLDL